MKQVTCRQADGRAGHLDVSDEEDALLGEPVSPAPAATVKTTFSPLTSSSIHKLTTSPLVASQVVFYWQLLIFEEKWKAGIRRKVET